MKKLLVCLCLLLSLMLTACSSVSEAFDLDKYWNTQVIEATQSDNGTTTGAR